MKLELLLELLKGWSVFLAIAMHNPVFGKPPIERDRPLGRSPALLRDRRSCPSSRLPWRDIFTDGTRDEQSIWTRRHGKPQACDQRSFWSVAEGKAQQGSRSDTGCATAPDASGEAQSGRSLSFGQRSHGGAEEVIGRHRTPCFIPAAPWDRGLSPIVGSEEA